MIIDQGLLTEAEMNRLCYFGASIIPVYTNGIICDKVHNKKVEVRKSLLKNINCAYKNKAKIK